MPKIKPTGMLLLLATSSLVLVTPITYSQAPAAPPPATATATAPAAPTIKFDVVSFKACAENTPPATKNTIMPTDGDFVAKHCQSIARLIDVAYGGPIPYQLKGEPQWVDDAPYEFLAKVAPEDVPVWQKMDTDSRRLMLRVALNEALNLKMRVELQSRPVYALVVDKGGLKIPEHKPGPNDPPANMKLTVGGIQWTDYDVAVYTRTSMPGLASALAARLDRDVVDRTGLTGYYDFTVKPLPWDHYDPKSSSVEDTDFSAIINGVRNLGLRLDPAKADTNVLTIDHVDRPPTD